jgi:hypothetical protein
MKHVNALAARSITLITRIVVSTVAKVHCDISVGCQDMKITTRPRNHPSLSESPHKEPCIAPVLFTSPFCAANMFLAHQAVVRVL